MFMYQNQLEVIIKGTVQYQPNVLYTHGELSSREKIHVRSENKIK